MRATAGGGGNGVMELDVSAGLVGDTPRGDVMENKMSRDLLSGYNIVT